MPLPDDSPKKWAYKEHTRVKHEILSKYLGGWTNILGKFYKLNIFDCFAGRGRFPDGSEGSPLIIIKTIARIREKMRRPNGASCVFIERSENNFQNLQEEINREIENSPQRYGDWLNVEWFNNEFANVASGIIDKYGERLAPSFFFIDPFGFSGVPFEVIKNILSLRRTEVFMTFMVRDVNRFFESSHHTISIEELYSMNNVQNVLQNQYPSLPREQALLKLYRDQLHEDGGVKYTMPFKISEDERLQTTYYLIHATNHPAGCELMKEIMYKAGTEGRFGYLGPDDGQLALTQFAGIAKLKKLLLNRFKGRILSYKDLRYETLMDTDFIKKHYHEALLELESEGKISMDGMGPRGGLPDGAKIAFIL